MTRRVIFPPDDYWTQPPTKRKKFTAMTDTTTPPLGDPENPQTRRAPVDSVLLLQAFHHDDSFAQQVVLKTCDPYSVALQLCGWLLATFRQYGVDTDERLGIWRAVTQAQVGEAEPNA